MVRVKSPKWVVSIIVLLSMSAFSLSFFYNLNHGRIEQMETLMERSIQAYLESSLDGLSVGYFQWDDMYYALERDDQEFFNDNVEDIMSLSALFTEVKLKNDVYEKDGFFEVYCDGTKMYAKLGIYDDNLERKLEDKYVSVKIDMDRLLVITHLDALFEYDHNAFHGIEGIALRSREEALKPGHYVSSVAIGILGMMMMHYLYSYSIKSHFEIEGLEAIVEMLSHKDKYTAEHSKSVADIAVRIAKKMHLPRKEVRALFKAGHLHDIGKIGIPEQILNKEGRLTPEEYSIIKRHPETGYEIVSQFPNLREVAEIVKYHHEKLDGSGYPYGLTKDQIPLSAQILTVADIYEALTSDRPYRKGHSMDKAFEIMDEIPINHNILSMLKELEQNKG